jgi:hypothetical protein
MADGESKKGRSVRTANTPTTMPARNAVSARRAGSGQAERSERDGAIDLETEAEEKSHAFRGREMPARESCRGG